MYPSGFNTEPVLDYRHAADQAAGTKHTRTHTHTHTHTHTQIKIVSSSHSPLEYERIWGVCLRWGSGSWKKHKGFYFGELHRFYLVSLLVPKAHCNNMMFLLLFELRSCQHTRQNKNDWMKSFCFHDCFFFLLSVLLLTDKTYMCEHLKTSWNAFFQSVRCCVVTYSLFKQLNNQWTGCKSGK